MNRLATPTRNRRRKRNGHDVQGESKFKRENKIYGLIFMHLFFIVETSNGTIKMTSLRKRSVTETTHQKIAAGDNVDDVQVCHSKLL